MTPIALRIQLSLDAERQRMRNEWFFKWHFIGRDGPVEIDGFDGRKIRYGGIKFEGTPRHVYWGTLKRYLKMKNGETFDRLEAEVKGYPEPQIQSAINETKTIMETFARGLIGDAIDKDRVLRGDGINFPPPDRGQGERLTIFHEIESRAQALTELCARPQSRSWLKKTENFLREYKQIVALLLVLVGAIGTGAYQIAKVLWPTFVR